MYYYPGKLTYLTSDIRIIVRTASGDREKLMYKNNIMFWEFHNLDNNKGFDYVINLVY